MRVPIDTVYSNTGWRLEKERRREGEKYICIVHKYVQYVHMCMHMYYTYHCGIHVSGFYLLGGGGEGSTPNSISSPQNFNENLLKVYI